MSAITEILDRLSGIASLKERVAATNRHVDKSLTWLLDHEKRLIQLEAAATQATAVAPEVPPLESAAATSRRRRLPEKR